HPRRDGAGVAPRSGAVRSGGGPHPDDVPLSPSRGPGRPRHRRAERASPLLHRRLRPRRAQRGHDRRRAPARAPHRATDRVARGGRADGRGRGGAGAGSRGGSRAAPGAARGAASRGGAAAPLRRRAAPGGRPHRASAAAGRVRVGRGAGHGGAEHAAGIAASGRQHLVPLLRRPRHGVPAGRVRHRAGHGVAAHHGGPGRARGPRRPHRHAGLLPPRLGLRRDTPRWSAFVPTPAATGLLALGAPIVGLLFQRGRFSAEDAAATTVALAAYAVGLPAFSATRIAAQTFYALGDTRTPVMLGLLSVVANVGLALGLMWPLAHAGLALASSLSAYVNLLALLWALRRRLGLIGGRALVRAVGRAAIATMPLWLVARALAPVWDGTAVAVALTVAAIVGGTLAFAVAAALLRAPELTALLGMLRRHR